MRPTRTFLTQVVSWMLLTTVIAGALTLIVVPKAADARPLTVLSGSMTGSYEIGDVVVVRPVDTDELGVGDVITFHRIADDPTLTTHRIDAISVGSEGRRFVTRGDANNAADLSPVEPAQVVGEVWYSVPLVGYLSVWASGDSVRLALDVVAIALLLCGGWYLAAGLLERRKKAVPA